MNVDTSAERNLVFISHANPEDNELALWLTLQLANEGYAVWCDLTKLLGGERFWEDIQDAIRNRTAKFIYLLSTAANEKRGTLDELDCAIGTEKRIGVKDFIITAKVDELAYDDVYIGIRRLNHISFSPSWARGLARILKKFEEDGVPKTPSFNRDAVCSWWRDQFSADAGVADSAEIVLSNWFKVEDIPAVVYEHRLTAVKPGPVGLDETTVRYPAVWLDDVSVLTFAKAADIVVGTNLALQTIEHSYEAVLSRESVKDGPKHVAQLFRLAWSEMVAKRLPQYEMANKQICFYFNGDLVKDDSLDFLTVDGKKAWRGVVGYKTIGSRVRYWHYGITGKPILRPETLFVMKGHVLFSDDRQNLWSDRDTTAKARRNQCRNWWNDDWRDRLLATMSHLADGQERLTFPVASDAAFTLPTLPILFESPVTYGQPRSIEKPDLDEYAFEDEDLEDIEPEGTPEDGEVQGQR